MDFDDNNPFAESNNPQANTQSYSSQPTSNDYNPFTNIAATPVQPPPPTTPIYSPPSPASNYLPQTPTPVYQPPSPTTVYQPSYLQPSTSSTVPQSQPSTYENVSRANVIPVENQKNDLIERERHLAERERALQTPAPIGTRIKNFPPLPRCCPVGPCFYQDISVEIPPPFQTWVRFLFFLWIIYSITLVFNMIAGLSWFAATGDGGSTFGLSIVYMILFIPASYLCLFRPVYRAFKTDSSVFFMIFFFICVMFIATNILFAIGLVAGMCGFARIGQTSTNKVVQGMMIVLGCLWSIIAALSVVLLIKIHQLYRRTGASFEQAQREFQTAFVNSPTVRGAAREVAAAGINEALRTDENQPRYSP